MFRRLFVWSVLFVFSCSLLAGCGSSQPTSVGLSFDFLTDAASIKAFTEGETFGMAMTAGPFYSSPLPLPGYDAFEQAKKDTIQEVLTTSQRIHEITTALLEKMEPFQQEYMGFLAEMSTQDGLTRPAKQLAAQRIALIAKEKSLEALYTSIIPTTGTNAYVHAQLSYQKVLAASDYAATAREDFRHMVTQHLALKDAVAEMPEALQKTFAVYEKKMTDLEDVSTDLQELQTMMAVLDIHMKQLATADYLLAKASLAYMQENLPALQEQTKTITASDQLTDENIEFITESLSQFSSFGTSIEDQIALVDTGKLLSRNPSPSPSLLALFVPNTYAKSDESLNAATDVLHTKVEGPTVADAAQFTWEAAKSGFGKAKTVIGVGLDAVSAITKTPMDILAAGYETKGSNQTRGDLISDTADTVKGNFSQIKKNYDNDTSGAEIWQNAGKGMERVETTAGDLAASPVKYVIGEGRTTWAISNVAKITVSMFTGLGKGIYKIADKEATAGQVVEGMLDVGLSFIGGSKVIIKGSQAAAGGKDAIKRSASKAFNYLKQMATNLEKTKIKGATAEILKNAKLTSAQVTSLISKSLEMEGKELVAQELKAIGAKLNKEFVDIVKSGIKTIYGNMTTDATKSFKEFVKLNLEHSMQGYKEALIKTLGEGYIDYIDNLVASKIDDLIKAAVKTYIDATIYDGEYAFNIPAGEKLLIPFKAKVENGALQGGIDFSATEDSRKGNLKIDIKGIVSENGSVAATWEGSLDAGGPSSEFDFFGTNPDPKECIDKITVKGSGILSGLAITGAGTAGLGTMTLIFQGTYIVAGGSTFWCETIKDFGTKQALEEVDPVVLDRIQ